MAIFNESIRSKQIQLINEQGENVGVVDTQTALAQAKSIGLDLVIVTESGAQGIPVARILDYKKKLYEDKKKVAKSKKKQHDVQTKELRLSPKIQDNDLFNTKGKQAITFLKEGNRVKFVLMLRGRERSLKDTLGVAVFERLFQYLKENVALPGREIVFEDIDAGANGIAKMVYIKKGEK